MRNIILASVTILTALVASAASAETMYQQPYQQYTDEGRVVYEQRQPMAVQTQQAQAVNKPAAAANNNNIMQFNFGM